ncbi:MAG: hypothetical protein RR255_00365 [Bacilli bacterium]
MFSSLNTDLTSNTSKINVLNSVHNENGSALRLLGDADSNVIYGCYTFGIYNIKGTEIGLPISNYVGYLETIRYIHGHIIKILTLVNGQFYTMAQKTDGTVITSWQLK